MGSANDSIEKVAGEIAQAGAEEYRLDAATICANARSFERELIIAKLKAEALDESGPVDSGDDHDYRVGWNQRARSIVEMLGGTW